MREFKNDCFINGTNYVVGDNLKDQLSALEAIAVDSFKAGYGLDTGPSTELAESLIRGPVRLLMALMGMDEKCTEMMQKHDTKIILDPQDQHFDLNRMISINLGLSVYEPLLEDGVIVGSILYSDYDTVESIRYLNRDVNTDDYVFLSLVPFRLGGGLKVFDFRNDLVDIKEAAMACKAYLSMLEAYDKYMSDVVNGRKTNTPLFDIITSLIRLLSIVNSGTLNLKGKKLGIIVSHDIINSETDILSVLSPLLKAFTVFNVSSMTFPTSNILEVKTSYVPKDEVVINTGNNKILITIVKDYPKGDVIEPYTDVINLYKNELLKTAVDFVCSPDLNKLPEVHSVELKNKLAQGVLGVLDKEDALHKRETSHYLIDNKYLYNVLKPHIPKERLFMIQTVDGKETLVEASF